MLISWSISINIIHWNSWIKSPPSKLSYMSATEGYTIGAFSTQLSGVCILTKELLFQTKQLKFIFYWSVSTEVCGPAGTTWHSTQIRILIPHTNPCHSNFYVIHIILVKIQFLQSCLWFLILSVIICLNKVRKWQKNIFAQHWKDIFK